MNLHACLILLALTTASAVAVPSIKVMNRQFPDGSGSSKTVNRDTRTAEEIFVDSNRKMTHKITYTLDDRLQPLTASYFNIKGVLQYTATYKLDGADRIAQEVVTDPKGKLLYTRNYHYGSKNGKSIVTGIDVYDDQNRLLPPPGKKKKR